MSKSVLIEFAPSKFKKKINKHPKFDHNSDIQQQFEHFEYEMNQTLNRHAGGFITFFNKYDVS